ncbi:chondroitin sulfate synthase 2-like [Octopus sinensis]|uniref:Hexosyltransferase n=1 Tax=Octopus sinensis TaxID=2607531 RepID=A0A6P7SV64_9MOLL|nr:chondroitin sulfate synthase 2-like [Octopus sinensis]
MVIRKFRLCWRPVAPCIIGLCLGITFSLIYVPFISEQRCSVKTDEEKQLELIKLRETKSLHVQERFAGPPPQAAVLDSSQNQKRTQQDNNAQNPVNNADNINKKNEPRLKLQGQGNVHDSIPVGPPAPGIKFHKMARPRYISTELGIREKLFVAVITSPESLDTLAVAFNKSVAHHVTKLVFFNNKKSMNYAGSGMTVIGFSQANSEHILPLLILKYLGDHYSNTFDYYMFVSDKTYVRGEKVFDLVSDISVSEDVYLGAVQKDGKCTLDGGVIISQSMLAMTLKKLKECYNVQKEMSMEVVLERCLLQSTGKSCKKFAGDQTYSYLQVAELDYDNMQILHNARLKPSIAFAPMPDDISAYKLHKYFCQMDLNTTLQEIEQTKEEILYLSQFAPGGKSSLSWPIGVPEPFKPKNRFDVIHWQYFTATHLYFDNDYSNEKVLSGVNKLDVNEVIKLAQDKLAKKYKKRYSFSRLVNGYRRFDPYRGMEYIVDFALVDNIEKKTIEKRLHMVRPLGHVEIIPMPYVTENTQVNLILPVSDEDKNELGSFLDSYAQNCLDAGDNTNLLIVFIYKNNSHLLDEDKFYVLKSMITYYNNKYHKEKIRWVNYETASIYVPDLMLMDSVSQHFLPESLLLLSTVGMDLATEFFNRVRMNSILNWQVFFPIGFWQYKPNLIYDKRPYPTSIDLKRNVGHFDVYSYEHSSFYNKDYQEARKSIPSKEVNNYDLFRMFLKHKKVHVLRAIEPTLKHRYKTISCIQSSPKYIYERCRIRRLEALANRSQLARLIFEYEEKMEKLKLKKKVIFKADESPAANSKNKKTAQKS